MQHTELIVVNSAIPGAARVSASEPKGSRGCRSKGRLLYCTGTRGCLHTLIYLTRTQREYITAQNKENGNEKREAFWVYYGKDDTKHISNEYI